MTDLVLHDLDDALHARLLERARTHQRSVEEEVLAVLQGVIERDAVNTADAPAEDPGGSFLVDLATRLFGPENGVDLKLPPRRDGRQRPPLDFSGPEYDR